MSTIAAILRELLGLFVDDGGFALQIIAVAALAALSATLAPGFAAVTAAILVFGCVGILLVNTCRRR